MAERKERKKEKTEKKDLIFNIILLATYNRMCNLIYQSRMRLMDFIKLPLPPLLPI